MSSVTAISRCKHDCGHKSDNLIIGCNLHHQFKFLNPQEIIPRFSLLRMKPFSYLTDYFLWYYCCDKPCDPVKLVFVYQCVKCKKLDKEIGSVPYLKCSCCGALYDVGVTI